MDSVYSFCVLEGFSPDLLQLHVFRTSVCVPPIKCLGEHPLKCEALRSLKILELNQRLTECDAHGRHLD